MITEIKTYKITDINKYYVTLNNHILIDKKRIKLTIGDKLKINDIITNLIIDYDKHLLECLYFKGFNENHYKELNDLDLILK